MRLMQIQSAWTPIRKRFWSAERSCLPSSCIHNLPDTVITISPQRLGDNLRVIWGTVSTLDHLVIPESLPSMETKSAWNC